MKTRWMLLLLSVIFLFGGSSVLASAEDFETETESETADPTLWMQYRLQIDDEVYTFPMKAELFTSRGWAGGIQGGTLEPWKYERYLFTRDDETCSAYLLNLSDQTLPLEECLIAGIVIEEHDWADTDSVISLPGDIIRGVSTGEDILAAYGEPSETTQGSLYTIYTYREDIDREVELEIYNTSGLLENIRIENFAESNAAFASSVSEEVPARVQEYTKPESLSESMTSYEIELEGSVYALPVPLNVLIADGWELDLTLSDGQIPAQYFGWATLKKGDLSFTQTVMNPEEYALAPENCWLESLQIGGTGMEAEGSLPGGVRIGMSESRFLALLKDEGMSYEQTDYGDETCYTYNEDGYGHDCEVTVIDGNVAVISCENAIG